MDSLAKFAMSRNLYFRFFEQGFAVKAKSKPNIRKILQCAEKNQKNAQKLPMETTTYLSKKVVIFFRILWIYINFLAGATRSLKSCEPLLCINMFSKTLFTLCQKNAFVKKGFSSGLFLSFMHLLLRSETERQRKYKKKKGRKERKKEAKKKECVE